MASSRPLPADLATRVDAYDVRGVHPAARLGTASDRYAGWIGQVYAERWRTEVASRSRSLAGENYTEHTVPVATVAEYFEHFDVLELDFTFYRPLAEDDGSESSNAYVLARYMDHIPPHGRVFLKAPQVYTARRIRRHGRFEENPDYLDAEAYRRRFLEPAQALVGEQLGGVIFEQEYVRKADAPEPSRNVAELDAFFRAVPTPVQHHVELRTPHLLTGAYHEWLGTSGLGSVFSHWTYLPPLAAQFEAARYRFTAANGEAVVRLLTPRLMTYADAYALAYPFDGVCRALADTAGATVMVDDTVRIVSAAVAGSVVVNVFANNRAWGNAPALAQTLARQLAPG